jgi:hypothetical protein
MFSPYFTSVRNPFAASVGTAFSSAIYNNRAPISHNNVACHSDTGTLDQSPLDYKAVSILIHKQPVIVDLEIIKQPVIVNLEIIKQPVSGQACK